MAVNEIQKLVHKTYGYSFFGLLRGDFRVAGFLRQLLGVGNFGFVAVVGHGAVLGRLEGIGLLQGKLLGFFHGSSRPDLRNRSGGGFRSDIRNILQKQVIGIENGILVLVGNGPIKFRHTGLGKLTFCHKGSSSLGEMG